MVAGDEGRGEASNVMEGNKDVKEGRKRRLALVVKGSSDQGKIVGKMVDWMRTEEQDNLEGLQLEATDSMARVRDSTVKYFNRKSSPSFELKGFLGSLGFSRSLCCGIARSLQHFARRGCRSYLCFHLLSVERSFSFNSPLMPRVSSNKALPKSAVYSSQALYSMTALAPASTTASYFSLLALARGAFFSFLTDLIALMWSLVICSILC
ncbi:hypothetical protein CRG98_027439 [Punica granatum]|uniref:Uncharacterized protein n=1 Tax=Punica granatum TaxID=22663 RepID=A0A2I0J7F4_PUNGR|nr:hypothetical protein CRG98_027439 [Punica granatum]